MRYRRVTARYVRLAPRREPLIYGDVLRALEPVGVAPLSWRPAADVCETTDAITVTLEIAGLDEDGIDVGLYEDALVIEGERVLEGCGPEGWFHVAEIRQGRFRIEVGLPVAVDPDRVDATYDRGLLRVELGKRAPSEVPG